VKTEVRRADPREFVSFLQASDAYAASLYPAESNHLLDVETLLRPEMHFFVVYEGDRAQGCGGFWAHDRFVEIKRVWVDPSARGKGLSRTLMTSIEREAQKLGYSVARLETGVHQPAALALYQALGYQECGPFGEYKPDPMSVFFEKRL
jgi:putative acetyltransferase